MKLQDQKADRGDETSQGPILSVLQIKVKAEISLAEAFWRNPWKEQGHCGLITPIFSGKSLFQVLHLSLNHRSVDRGETGQEHSWDDEIPASDGEPQADDQAPEIKRVASESVGTRNGQFVVLSDMTCGPSSDKDPNKSQTAPYPKTLARWRREIQIQGRKNESCRNPNPGQCRLGVKGHQKNLIA